MARMIRLLAFVLLLSIVPVSAQGDDMVDAVAETVTAMRKADATEFAKLAARNEPDPWLVADRLVRAGDGELALRFATAKPRAAVQGLPQYLRTKHEPSKTAYEAISLAQLRLEDDRATKEQIAGAIGALSAAVTGATPMEKARMYSLLGMAHAYAGDVAASSRDLASAAATAESIGWLREAADALGTASENARVNWRYEDAIKISRRELKLRHKLQDEARVVMHLQRLAQLFDEFGSLPAAMRALDEWNDKLGPEANAELAITRANIRMQLADLDAVLAILDSARPQNVSQRARIAMLAGDALRQRGEEADALARYRAAVAYAEESKDLIAHGRALGNAGISLVRLGKPKKARVLIEKAQTQFAAAKNRSLVALAVMFRGEAHFAAGEYPQALTLFNSARAYASRVGDGWLEASATLRRGRTLLASNDVDDARRTFSYCYELGLRIRTPVLAAAGAAGEARCLLRQRHGVRAAEAVDRGAKALAPLIEAVAVPPGDEARRIFNDLAAARVEAAILNESERDIWRALEIQRLGLQVRSARDARLLRKRTMNARSRKMEETARALIQRTALFEDRARDEGDRTTAVRFKATRQGAERELAKIVDHVVLEGRPGAERLYPRPVPLATLRERLTPNEVLVSYALTEGRAAAMLVSRAEVRVVALEDSAMLKVARGEIRRGLMLDPLKLRRSQTRVMLVLPPELQNVWFGGDRAFTRMPSATEFDRIRSRGKRRGEGTTERWEKAAQRWRAFIGPAPTPHLIEESQASASIVILTKPIDSVAVPRAFFLVGCSTVVAPLKAVDRAAAAALLEAIDAGKPPGPGWIVWGG